MEEEAIDVVSVVVALLTVRGSDVQALMAPMLLASGV
jgi:hypothetical protein